MLCYTTLDAALQAFLNDGYTRLKNRGLWLRAWCDWFDIELRLDTLDSVKADICRTMDEDLRVKPEYCGTGAHDRLGAWSVHEGRLLYTSNIRQIGIEPGRPLLIAEAFCRLRVLRGPEAPR